MKLLSIVFFISFSLSALAAADPKAQEVIKKFDIGYYRPQDRGLKELVLRVDIENLTKQLNEQLIFGKLNEVYFKLYWTLPLNVDVEVIGLPDGFTEIKQELKAMIVSRFDLIVPQLLDNKFQGYAMKYNKGKEGDEIVSTDTTQTKMIHEFVAKFDKEGNLSSLVGRKPMATEESNLVYAKFPWSQNKWIVTSINVKMSDATQTTLIDSEIEYTTVEGYGFPKMIKSKSKQTIQNGDKKPIERSFDSEMTFKDFKVNSGEAQTWLKKNKVP
ncbi:MAG: hypothetical protein ACOYL6_04875 [Bacteriovoracaceae bacterium]